MGVLFFIAITSAKGEAFKYPPLWHVPRNKSMAPRKKTARPDHDGEHRKQYEINKRKILATQSICALCGKPVDMSLSYPHPLSACVDHIIPIAKGGHPSDINNLQLSHWACNRAKSDRVVGSEQDFKDKKEKAKVIGNRNLPLSVDWATF